LQAGREQAHLCLDTPQSNTRRLLKTGGVSFLLHFFLITSVFLSIGGGGSNGKGDGRGGSYVYHVTMRPLSGQNDSHPSSRRELRIAQTLDRQERPTSVVMSLSSMQASSRKEPETGLDDVTIGAAVEGQAAGEEAGSGSGGDGSGNGLNFFGLKGFGRSDVSPPRYIENPKPQYPQEARKQGYEGKVLLKVEVLPNGRVGEVKLEKASGYAVLNQSALEAMKHWRFIPAKQGKVPIRSWVNILMTFRLRDSGF
jgi:TonB family protein